MNPFVKAKIYQTKGIACLAAELESFKVEIIISLARFFRQDWGEVCSEDSYINEEALKYKDFILAAYDTSEGKIWITAESDDKKDYNTITVLLPSEY